MAHSLDPTALSAIVFDAVGTLIYADPPAANVYHSMASDEGWQGTQDQVRRRLAGAVSLEFGRWNTDSNVRDLASDPPIAVRPPHGQDVNQDLQHRRRWRAVVSRVFEELDVPSAGRVFERLWHYFASPTAWRVYDDAHSAFEWCQHRGYLYAIASNFDSRLHRVVAGHSELAQASSVFTSAQIGAEKPNRAFFEAIGETLGASPNRLMMIGDDRHADYLGALESGWSSVWLDRSFDRPYDRERISSLRYLPNWIER